MKLEGLSAIVTGGASGLGNAMASMLVHNGARVAIFDINEDAGDIYRTYSPSLWT